ncbi:unnamed protein product, partial [marine sediment metagenome]
MNGYDAIIMAGHENIETNQDWSLRPKTGAPQEQIFTISLTRLIVNRLEADGFRALSVDANNHEEIYREDAGIFLTIHYDAYFAAWTETLEDGSTIYHPEKPRG